LKSTARGFIHVKLVPFPMTGKDSSLDLDCLPIEQYRLLSSNMFSFPKSPGSTVIIRHTKEAVLSLGTRYYPCTSRTPSTTGYIKYNWGCKYFEIRLLRQN